MLWRRTKEGLHMTEAERELGSHAGLPNFGQLHTTSMRPCIPLPRAKWPHRLLGRVAWCRKSTGRCYAPPSAVRGFIARSAFFRR